METFRTLIKGYTPPVGNRISLSKIQTDLKQLPGIPGYHPVLTDSGTSALALAISLAKQKQPHIQTPEIIIPGYGCPDLVAASIYAGMKPIVIDTNPDTPFFDINQLEEALNQNTAAIIAVNFLGIAENSRAIQSVLNHHQHPAILIEDNAQWLPEENTPLYPCSTYSIISFGRGKPASLLGGGALLCKDKKDPLNAKQLISHHLQPTNGLFDQLKIHLYNRLITPFFYQLLARNPLLKLGKTELQLLSEITELPTHKKELLQANIELTRSTSTLEISRHYSEALKQPSGPHPLTTLINNPHGNLLRFPILCKNKSERDKLLNLGHKLGLGFSGMYLTALDKIPGVAPLITPPKPLINSQGFADRLLTLPLHSNVSKTHTHDACQLLLSPSKP